MGGVYSSAAQFCEYVEIDYLFDNECQTKSAFWKRRNDELFFL